MKRANEEENESGEEMAKKKAMKKRNERWRRKA
jgi:hypothetical protein